MFLEKKVDPKSNGLKILIPQKQCRNFEKLCTKFVGFCSLIHRAGPPQIQTPQGFPPGVTSSVSLRLPPSPREKALTKAMDEVSSYCVRDSLLFCSLIPSHRTAANSYLAKAFRPASPHPSACGCRLLLGKRLWFCAKLRKPFSSCV